MNMTLKKSMAVALFGALLQGVASAASPDKDYLKLTSMEVDRKGDLLELRMTLDPSKVKPGRDREVVFQPVLTSGDSTQYFPGFTIAGRNRYYSHLRNDGSQAEWPVYQSGKGPAINYVAEVSWRDWMDDSMLTMEQATQDCCKPVTPIESVDLARLENLRAIWQAPVTSRRIAMTDDSAVELEAQGSAFIDFIVNRTEIKPDYRGNRRELGKILSSIDKVKEDPDATITKLTIKGFASPEGSFDNNVRLAMGRTAALKEYVREHYDFDPEIMMTDYEPEDWEGLRKRVLEMEIDNKEGILEIIDSSLAPDPKNAEIQKRFPTQYKLLLDSVYPALRHSDYTVRYRIRTYVSLDELKKVFKEAPERLRPVDFFRIAESLDDEKAADEVLLTAARIYPNDGEAAVNGANIMLKRGEPQLAAKMLESAGESPEAWFSRGSAAAAMGDYERAQKLFAKAAELGLPDAQQELESLRDCLDGLKVTYLLDTIPAD